MRFLILLALACDDGQPEAPEAIAPVAAPGLYRLQLGAAAAEDCGPLAPEASAFLDGPAHGGLFEVAWYLDAWGRRVLRCAGPEGDSGFTCPEDPVTVTWEAWGTPLTVTETVSAEGGWDATGTVGATLDVARTCSGSACSEAFSWAGDDGGSCSTQASFDLELTVGSQGHSCSSGTYVAFPPEPGWIVTAVRPTATPTTLDTVAVQLRHHPSCSDGVDVRVFAAPGGDPPASFPDDYAVGSTGDLVLGYGAEWGVVALDRAVEVGEDDLVWVAVAVVSDGDVFSCPLRCRSSAGSAWATAGTGTSPEWSDADPVAVMLGADGGSWAASEPPALYEGTYSAEEVMLENDTCGIFSGLLPVHLDWTGETSFELSYDPSSGVSTILCEWDGGGGATCGGFTQALNADGFSVLLQAETRGFSIVSGRDFQIDWSWALGCESGDCQQAGESLGVELPCSLDVTARFSL